MRATSPAIPTPACAGRSESSHATREGPVVFIGSATDVHEAHLLASVRAGKAVLCEKPIADSLDRAKHCLDAARAAKVIAAVGFNRRFDVNHRAGTRAGDY